MKLGEDILVEIVAIVQNGFLLQSDVSDSLRSIDLVERDGKLYLSDDYLARNGRKKSHADLRV